MLALHQGRSHAQLSRAYRGDISAGATAQNDEIEVFGF
jgi:hypothetical protein